MKSDELIEQLLSEDPILPTRGRRMLRNPVMRAAAQGRLTRLLPGVYVDAGRAEDLEVRAAAVARWDPSAVICGRAAAGLTYWPEVKVTSIEVASPVRHAPQPGFVFTERRIPTDLIHELGEGVRTTTPSLTAVELGTFDFTDPIDIALRRRKVSLASMREAIDLTPHRRGHADRRRVLLDSRDEPWSAAERLAQRIYRRAGITDWVANLKLILAGATYFLDLGFRRERVASEIDGRLHETDVDVFETDRTRQNALVLDGWLVLRFTWYLLNHEPGYVIATTREALALRRTDPGFNGLWLPDTPRRAG